MPSYIPAPAITWTGTTPPQSIAVRVPGLSSTTPVIPQFNAHFIAAPAPGAQINPATGHTI